MKYLAVLKDSLREAIDTKVFYVMVVLSLIVILFVAGISYTPTPAEQAIPGIVHSQAFRQSFADRGKSVIPIQSFLAYEAKNVRALTDQGDPSARDHVLELIVTERSPFMLHSVVHSWLNKAELGNATPRDPQTGAPAVRVSDEQIVEFLKYQFGMAGNLEIAEIKKIDPVEPDGKDAPPKPGTHTFQVTTKGKSGVRGWPHTVSLFFGLAKLPELFQASLGRCVYFIENTLIGGFGAWVAILVGVVISSFFIPNMLRKGTIDMLLAKPIRRPTLLIYKYIGGLSFVFLSSTIAIGGTWLVLGLRSGIWAPGFLMTIGTLTFFFAILYSVSALFAVLTRSAIVAILVTCMAWFVLWLLGIGNQALSAVGKDEALAKQFNDNGWGWTFVASDSVHAVLPRTSDITVLNEKLIAQCLTESEQKAMRLDLLPDVHWGETFLVSGLFIGIMLGLACLKFHFKDY
jgi:ABC-type transport system involved in multi-copper enzyme maturation permease subunit